MKPSKNLLTAILLASSLSAFAQNNEYPALAQLYSQVGPRGSARMLGLGGSYSALGADISNAGGNPAGLGFYRKSEFSISPSLNFNSNSSFYIDKTTDATKSQFNIGNIGLVIAGNDRDSWSGWKSGSFAITYSRENNLNNTVSFGALNNRSSMTDSFAETANNEAANSGTKTSDFDSDFNSNGINFDFPTSMYYYGYLIEPTTTNGAPYTGVELKKSNNQAFIFNSTGATSQWNVAYGANYMDKLYLGAQVSLPRFTYNTTKSYKESFVNPIEINGFTSTNNLQSSGRGLNIAIGAVYRPNEVLRIGGSITTPTWYDITETTSQALVVDVKGIEISNANTQQYTQYLNNLRAKGYAISDVAGKRFITSIPKLFVSPFESNYKLTTPFKANGGVAIFFGKRGFVSGDVEYVGYSGMRFKSDDANSDVDLRNGGYNQDVRRIYQNVVNLKAGGELRLNPIYLRGGVAYYADPVKSTDGIDRSRFFVSLGAGYKDETIFFDIAAVTGTTQSAYNPYVLNDNTKFASSKISNTSTNITATFGVYF
jgi:hypothetical protein